MPVFLNIWLTQSFEENIAFRIEDTYTYRAFIAPHFNYRSNLKKSMNEPFAL